MTTKDDMDEVFRLMQYARDNGYAINDVEVGVVKLRLFDTQLEAREGLKPAVQQRLDIWEENGVKPGVVVDGTEG